MDIFTIKNNFLILMDIVIIDLIDANMVQWTSMMIAHAMMMDVQKKTQSYKLSELKKTISFPLLLKHMNAFIFIFIFFLSLVHKPLSHVINDLFFKFQCLFITINNTYP
jgi:hypothetical protein